MKFKLVMGIDVVFSERCFFNMMLSTLVDALHYTSNKAIQNAIRADDLT
jgi:hypothetical protein